MIYTVTLNPALDRELTVSELAFDTVLRAQSERTDCGGKGLNVSRMIAQLGSDSTTLGFIAGHSGERLKEMLHARGISTDFVQVSGETRTNTSVVTQGGGSHFKVNAKGAPITAEQLQKLLDQVQSLAKVGDYWVLAGSLPPGVSADIYAQIITILRTAGAHALLDTSREPLRLGCAAAPWVIKPNLSEAKAITGESEPVAAARALQALGADNVLMSLGADGALLVTAAEAAFIPPVTIEERNPIGAGDAMVGGFVWAMSSGKMMHEAARWGVACGTVAASLNGTDFGSRAQIESMLARMSA